MMADMTGSGEIDNSGFPLSGAKSGAMISAGTSSENDIRFKEKLN